MARAIGTLGTIDSITVGGRVITTLTGLIILNGSGASGNAYCTPRKMTASSGYTPSGGLKYQSFAIRSSSTADHAAQFGYADNDIGLSPTNSGPTNGKTVGLLTLGDSGGWVVAGTDGTVEAIIDIEIPNGKYAAGYTNQADQHSYQIFGYEV